MIRNEVLNGLVKEKIDEAYNAATTEERVICRVDDASHLEIRDGGLDKRYFRVQEGRRRRSGILGWSSKVGTLVEVHKILNRRHVYRI